MTLGDNKIHKRNHNGATRELPCSNHEVIKEHHDSALQHELSILDTQDGTLWKKTKRL